MASSQATSISNSVTPIARRYASALFSLARDENAIEAVAGDMASLAAMLSDSDDFRALVTSPLLARGEQVKAVTALGEAAGLAAITVKALGTLASNRRLSQLGGVIRGFEQLHADHKGELTATVTAARALTKKQQTELAKQLKLAMGRDVALMTDVDESLIGGLIVKVGSRMVDASMKTQLDNLRVAMKGVQ